MKVTKIEPKYIEYSLDGDRYKDSWKIDKADKIVLTSHRRKNGDKKGEKVELKFNNIHDLYLKLLLKFDLKPSELDILVEGNNKKYVYYGELLIYNQE